jgi:dicarboxylate/amino acid:cation (Na+ or H+) symporter, DAACS family
VPDCPVMSAQGRILIGIGIGVGVGLAANLLGPAMGPEFQQAVAWSVEKVAQPIGQLFLRLLFMLVVPLLFAALVMGVCELDLKQMGRLGMRMLGYTVTVSSIAVLIGLLLVNVFAPGKGMSDEVRALAAASKAPQAAAAPTDASPVAILVNMVPDNPFKAAATGDMLGVIVFALFFGAALSAVRTDGALQLRAAIQGLYDVLMRLIDWVLKLAPLGVGVLLYAMMARLGLPILMQLAGFVGVVLLGLGLHMFGVYSVLLRTVSGMSPWHFFKEVRLAMVTAFSTASSNATLPTALKVAEENLKLPRHSSRFVLTAGSAMNQNGTALYEGVTVLFIAQLFGVDLSLAQQALVMLVCVLAGIGTAGVPAGSLPVIAMILGMIHVPPEGLGLILGVDRFLDMCRSTVNVVGDLAAAVYVSKGESQQPEGDAVMTQASPAAEVE